MIIVRHSVTLGMGGGSSTRCYCEEHAPNIRQLGGVATRVDAAEVSIGTACATCGKVLRGPALADVAAAIDGARRAYNAGTGFALSVIALADVVGAFPAVGPLLDACRAGDRVRMRAILVDLGGAGDLVAA